MEDTHLRTTIKRSPDRLSRDVPHPASKTRPHPSDIRVILGLAALYVLIRIQGSLRRTLTLGAT